MNPAASAQHPGKPILVPYGQDALAALAEDILTRHAGELPDLSRVTVLLPDPAAAPRLRRALRAGGQRALLGPNIITLRQWAMERGTIHGRVLSEQARELMLVEALAAHRTLFGESNPWTLASSFIDLFDELTLHGAPPSETLRDFQRALRKGYGLGDRPPRALGQEAQLVHTLWHAWHRQQQAEHVVDREWAYLRRLNESLRDLPEDARFYMAGYLRLAPPEQRWTRTLLERGQLTVVLQGQPRPPATPPDSDHPDQPLWALLAQWGYGDNAPPSVNASEPGERGDGYSPRTPDAAIEPPYQAYLETVFAPLPSASTTAMEPAETFAGRARHFARRHPLSPAAARLSVFEAHGAEQEARAVELQVRRWRLEGKKHIVIVTGDRRLARRVRALLERANIALHDTAGWALSTTSAAAALERWLQAVEEDFAYEPLTDLLKSSFVFPGHDPHALRHAVHRFEQDIVRRENVPRGLARYRQHLAWRQHRFAGADGTAVSGLLDEIATAAEPLLPFVSIHSSHAPGELLDSLTQSLRRLGMRQAFEQDAAGQRLLGEIEALRHALPGRNLPMTWMEFRAWLGRTLERYNFRPSAPSGSKITVELCSLEQSALVHADALIIAAAEAAHLPGAGRVSPFFNDAVRRELGLSGARDQYALRFHLFRRLLEAAPAILITARREQDGEEIAPSPWLEALQSFHSLAYGAKLPGRELAALLAHPGTEVRRATAPPPPASRPAPAVRQTLLPSSVSASAYQELVDCPYKFFAARALSLKPPDEVREALEKSDYGERVHRILQAFHGGHPELPGPFGQPLTPANRARAEEMLETISTAVFAQDLEDNFMHRGWYKRWRTLIPRYLDWQEEREQAWRVAAVEITARRSGDIPGVELTGRLDRLDRTREHAAADTAIIDYKTGRLPDAQAVRSGEAVQLPFYALLSDSSVTRVEYLNLDARNFGGKLALEDETLDTLRLRTGERLRTLTEQLRTGAPLPAWGDDNVCAHCVLTGICRKQSWPEQIPLE